MAKLVVAGKLPMEKFQASYGAWKNHISHGNCYRLMQQTDLMVSQILNPKKKSRPGAGTSESGAGE